MGSIALIEKAIGTSDLGLTPTTTARSFASTFLPDGGTPQGTLQDRFQVRRRGQGALRNVRRDAIDQIKKREKDGELSEDLSRDEQDKVQKVTDKFIADLEKLLSEKEADILKV